LDDVGHWQGNRNKSGSANSRYESDRRHGKETDREDPQPLFYPKSFLYLHVSQLLKAFQAQTISGTTWGAVVQSVAHSEHNSQHCVQPLARHHLSACCIHALDGLARSLYDRLCHIQSHLHSRYPYHRCAFTAGTISSKSDWFEKLHVSFGEMPS
jgi:hypothetical protein